MLCVSILRDKNVEEMLATLSEAGRTLVATTSSNARALTAEELAERAAPYFARVDAVADPQQPLSPARTSSAPRFSSPARSTSSPISPGMEPEMAKGRGSASVLLFAAAVVAFIVVSAFAVGYIVGKLIL